jgi:hypothetical protein
VAAGGIIATSRGWQYGPLGVILAFLDPVGEPASDEDARRAAVALRRLLSEPNELRDFWRASSNGVEWERDLSYLINGLEFPPREVMTWSEKPHKQPDDVVRVGDIYELPLSDARLIYVQVATTDQAGWWARVLPGSFVHRPSSDQIVELVAQPEQFVRIVRGLEEHPLVAHVPPPARFADGYPRRARVPKTAENPDGWSVALPDHRLLSGREFSGQHPDFDQTKLPFHGRPPHIRFLIEMLEHGRDPLTDKVRQDPTADTHR